MRRQSADTATPHQKLPPAHGSPGKAACARQNQNRCRKTDAAVQHDRDHAGPGCIFHPARPDTGQNHSNRRRCHAQHDNHQVHDLVRIDNRRHRGCDTRLPSSDRRFRPKAATTAPRRSAATSEINSGSYSFVNILWYFIFSLTNNSKTGTCSRPRRSRIAGCMCSILHDTILNCKWKSFFFPYKAPHF